MQLYIQPLVEVVVVVVVAVVAVAVVVVEAAYLLLACLLISHSSQCYHSELSDEQHGPTSFALL
jgi:hypothetical protein